jgi:hypothetical protein
MATPHTPRTPHQLCRLTTWARVWLEVALRALPAGILPEWIVTRLTAHVAYLQKLTVRLIFLRACARLGGSVPARIAGIHHGPLRARQAGLFRIAIGVDLRRALRGRGLRAQIAALLRILRDPEAAIAALAKRLRTGLAEPPRFVAQTIALLVGVTAAVAAAPNSS